MNFRKVTIAALLVSLGLFGAGVALGQQDGGPPPRGPGMDRGMPLFALDLSEAQKSQVSAIDSAQRGLTEPIAAQLREARKAIEEAITAGQFDEQQIRTLAAAEAQLQVELTVARAQRQAAVYQILTTEQRSRLNTLRAMQHTPQGYRPDFQPQ